MSCCLLCHVGSYGSTKRYKSVDRLIRVNNTTVLGAGGELSDLAYIVKCGLQFPRRPAHCLVGTDHIPNWQSNMSNAHHSLKAQAAKLAVEGLALGLLHSDGIKGFTLQVWGT